MMNGVLLDNSMSNLASASNEGSLSSKNRNEDAIDAIQPPKKKRNLPGNPDPEGEIIALSPRTLLATNRFVCEICHKGFQREQNLQLHRRGHNLPWKLKQRSNKEVKKKFYVCPEPSCVHHDPSRALGDLTGVKKHYCRKHGEKKWKCEKCSKRYAVQSDWKAHSKVCGTREYRCDCGTVFSRRDSFVTHRAFCDALAQESARTVTPNSLLSSQPGSSNSLFGFHSQGGLQALQLKREQDHHLQQSFNLRPEMPPWLVGPPPNNDLSSHLFTSRLDQPVIMAGHENNNPNPNHTFPSTFQTKASPHMSATALLQKAAEMGVTMSKPCQSEASFRPHQAHMTATEFNSTSLASSTCGSGLGLSSREEIGTGLIHGLASFMNKAVTSGGMEQITSTIDVGESSLLSNTISSLQQPPNGFERSSTFEDTFNGMLNSKNANLHQAMTQSAAAHLSGAGSSSDGLTRDFLGLTAFPHRDFLNMAGLEQMGSSSYDHQQNQNESPWQT